MRYLRRPKVVLPLVAGILAAILIFIAIHNMNSPAEGTVTQNNFDNLNQTTPDRSPKHYSDQFISFSYPSGYEMAPADKSTGLLDMVNLISSNRRDKYVAIGVVKETLDSDSGVNYRRLHPDIYKTVGQNPTSVVYSKLDSTEYTGFIAHGDKVASISFTSVSPQALEPDYKIIAGSLQFKQ